MEILSGQQMRNVDRRAIDERGLPGILLMEGAGRALTEALLADYPDLGQRRPLILCGKGNNGGDGLVVARMLARHRVESRVLLLARAGALRGDAAIALAAARACGIEVEEVPDLAGWSALREVELARAGLVVDAILGTGIVGGARGLAGRVIEDLNRAGLPVVAVDLPSGLDADSGEVAGRAVVATRTYTLCRPKIPLVFGAAAERAGTWRTLPIGIPDEVVAEEECRLEWFDGAQSEPRIASRPRRSHKGSFGHLLAVAGGRGKTGAAVLLARAALRTGVGLITVATGGRSARLVSTQQPEVMTESLPETAGGLIARRGAAPARRLLAERDALAIGPGLGTSAETRSVVMALVKDAAKPMVIDADALNALAAAPDGLGRLAASPGSRVLTPHPGEASRLLGRSTAAILRDRRSAAQELARAADSVVVLKGHRTVVASPDGRISVNGSGNPGMATAGSGDVLTGIIGALLARGIEPWNAARLGTYVHGDAGDRAARSRGEESLVAGDLVDHLDQALRAMSGSAPRRAGATW